MTAPTLVFGHGAGAGHMHPWMTRVGDGLRKHGIRVVMFDFPYIAEGRKVPDPAAKLEEAFQAAWGQAAAAATGPLFAGGKSMGGRIASQAAARGILDPAPAGLVFFGYPLHPPGKPAQRRDKHLPSITAPMLFLHGTRDQFGTPDEMRELTGGLPTSRLEIIDGGDHSLVASRKPSPENDTVQRAIDIAAAWLLSA